VTYLDVVDSVRRELAERLVVDRRVSVTEAAYLTGFADVSGFRRRYKRWTGRAPSRGSPHA
jgi:AraC-like DNA-binding protein